MKSLMARSDSPLVVGLSPVLGQAWSLALTRLGHLRAHLLARPGRAVVLDTETTDFNGALVELSIVDAHDGATLFSSLVNPGASETISAEANRVHGITDQMCRTQPSLPQLWPAVTEAVGQRTLTAWNAPFDEEVLRRECRRYQLPLLPGRWVCLMRMDAQCRGGARWRRLNAGHRALGDAQAAQQVLRQHIQEAR